MSLTKYNQKRNFNSTKEPKGTVARSQGELIFVIQKHQASHLHYDFRLEMDGVLKSWAVPKGPSMNPEDKRLAMMVEDHPYHYKDFEGNIPEGNYGAGNVIVWDQGTYIPSEVGKAEPEKQLMEELHKGRLSFIMKGRKLKGEFSLVKLKGKQENAWLLIKKQDKYATETDILLKNKSVLSKSTLEALEKKAAKKVISETRKKTSVTPKLKQKSSKVSFVKPMLANLSDKPFDSPDWIFEPKYDGYRTLAVVTTEEVNLFSRNHLSFNKQFKPIAEALKKLKHTAVLDGEIVIEEKDGRSNFQLLQNYLKEGKGKLKYYVFDILNLDGNDTTGLTLVERKELLAMLLKKHKLSEVHYSEHIVERGASFFELAQQKNLEGIIAKKADSPYRVGQRSNEWLKIKISQAEEAVIIGITQPRNSRSYFGALLLGRYVDNELQYVGKCGTGFKEETLKELYAKFRPQFTTKSPLNEKIKIREAVQWIKPKFVAQVKFTEWTQDGSMRHPVFLGLRVDKAAKDVNSTATAQKGNSMKNQSAKPEAKSEARSATTTENEYDLKVGKVTLHLTNQHKIYFPDDGITKGEIVQYYGEVADLMLPYLKDRPQSMNRFPNGINGESFYQKDVDLEKVPSWLKTTQVFSESNHKNIDYLICNDKATLMYMANLGCIEINPWNSTIKHISKPDWVVIDIDPAKDDFKEVVRTALTVKTIMDELETDCYCKTSGATGLHVYIPLGAKYEYETVKIFAELIAREVTKRLPKTTSIIRTVKKREEKIYIDFLQNRAGQTLAAPYSVRPKPGATVSTPLEWEEVNSKLSPSQFTIKNVMRRFEKKGDLWKPVLGKGATIEKIIKKIAEEQAG